VSIDEFIEFYRTLSCSYDDNNLFVNYVKGVWGVKQENIDNSKKPFAGGEKLPGNNGRERY
jgi:hypothetical protein